MPEIKESDIMVDKRTPHNVEDLIKNSLDPLKQQNPKAHDILIHLIEDGFFRKHQTKGDLDKCAHQLIGTIMHTEENHENSDH